MGTAGRECKQRLAVRTIASSCVLLRGSCHCKRGIAGRHLLSCGLLGSFCFSVCKLVLQVLHVVLRVVLQ